MIENYKAHCENLRFLDKAISNIQLVLRNSIAIKDNISERIHTNILSQLIANWTEVQLYKLLEEKDYRRGFRIFDDNEKQNILISRSIADKWKMALKISMCKSISINTQSDSVFLESKLSPTERFRYKSLLECIDNDLLNSYQIRNRIAHGQWKYAFNDDLSQFSADLTAKLRKENIVVLQLRQKLLISFCLLIREAAISPRTFKRDFDKHFQKIEDQKNNIHNRNYQKYKNLMIAKYQRGKVKKHQN